MSADPRTKPTRTAPAAEAEPVFEFAGNVPTERVVGPLARVLRDLDRAELEREANAGRGGGRMPSAESRTPSPLFVLRKELSRAARMFVRTWGRAA